ncbi:HAAS signaling domain-containing protein [Ornithinimicrobium pratense]|uniref:Uncharacterized protein n=1 Tax=Ornithinimicrobium pratense TaxID=2593973 RepID=A0A5J6V4U0_9MICO|nr:hypothetical protein [Ornithinimicrobium pratense]QFG68314.1 hypothetical protein FY030_05935 [Ornithinimicrobium pratense]
MMTALDHPLVQDYLDRLHAEAARLPVPEGRELQLQIREHLTEALPDEPSESEVRDVLDRLGDPAVLVDAAGGVTPGSGPGLRSDSDGPWREAGALVSLVGAGLLFWLPLVNLVLWVGGLVLLVLSRRWNVADKVWGAVVLGLGPLPFILLAGLSWTTSSEVCMSEGAAVNPDEGAAPPVVVTCTGGDGGLTPLNMVVWALTITYAVVYVWTLARLIRRAARPAER